MQAIIQSPKTQTIIGRLRKRIQIVDSTNAQDTTGGTDITQNNVVLTCWASIEALTATEKFAAHEFVAQVTHKVIIRNPRNSITIPGYGSQPLTKVLARMQIWYNKRTFQIEGVLNPVERPDLLMLMCIEIDDSLNQQSASPLERNI